MTSLLWMLALLPPALTAMSELPKPVNDIITSSHFTHMLTWEPGPGSPPGVRYNVTVRTSTGTSWVPVVGCQHVQHPLVCNLTEAFSERYKVYRSRVTALLDAQESQPVIQREFKPIRDTLLDLPLLTVTPCGPDMCVELQPPVERLRDIYDSLQYKLLMSNNADKFQVVQQTTSLRRRIFKNLVTGKWYCVSVCFSPGVVQRESNYSRPVCASTPGHYTADPWISSALCVLVAFAVVSGALWVYTRSTCRIDLPSVLKSIRHLQEALVIPSYSKSCILNVEPTSPSSGDKRNSQTSDESDGESVTGSTAGSSGGQYKMRLGNNLLSSSSASSSSSLSDLSSPEPNPLTSIGGQSPHTARPSDSVPTSQTVSGSEGLIPADEEDRKLVGEVGDHDVDLDTLTLGRLVEKVEQVEKLHHDWEVTESEVCNPISALPSLTRGTKEVAIGTVFCPLDDDEEEEEEGEEYDNGSSGGQYKMRLGNNLLSSSSASSSSSLLDLSSPEPNPLTSIGGQSPHTARPSDSVPTSQTVSGSEGLIPADEEDRKLVGEVGDHDVDLDTLTLGRLVEKVEQVEKLHHDWEVTESEVCNPISALPSLTRGTKEVAIGTVFCPLDDDEEEEEEGEEYDNDEQFGYMRRPCKFQN